MFCSRDIVNEVIDKMMTSNLLTNFKNRKVNITTQPFRVTTSNMDCKTLQQFNFCKAYRAYFIGVRGLVQGTSKICYSALL